MSDFIGTLTNPVLLSIFYLLFLIFALATSGYISSKTARTNPATILKDE
ncbi:hypothetical protein [Ekhidna sp.]